MLVRPARLRILAPWTAIVAGAIFLPRDFSHALVAATAGTLFEAAPVLAIAAVLPKRFAPVAALAGCGCGRGRLPGALAPVAFALCWISFGPVPALLRAAGACAIATALRHRGHVPASSGSAHRDDEPFADLTALAASAAACCALLAIAPAAAAGPPFALAFGLCAGLLAPCATAAVALAAATAPHAPLAAWAILATGGVVPSPRLHRRTHAPRGDGRFASVLLALALGALALRGPSGLVHPRLLPLVALGAVATAVRAVRAPRARGHSHGSGGFGHAGVPALMLAALVAGSPPPAYTATETTVASGFAGEKVAFTGIARRGDDGTTRLVRYAITCCRVDATAVALPLDRALCVGDGTWIAAAGILVTRRDGLVLRVDAWRAIPPPPDPFVYR